jgi:hypothetical protein
MGRKTVWKEIRFDRPSQMQELESVLSSFDELNRYSITFEGGAGIIETNMPWRSLRRWFTWAGVPLSYDNILTSNTPSWDS